MDRVETIWRWADATGLYMRHKDLNAEQIMQRYEKDCVRQGDRWVIVDCALQRTSTGRHNVS